MKESSLTIKSDEELMTAYKMGDLQAFNILYQRYSSKIYGYIRSKINSSEAADELFQQVFYKIHNKRSYYNNKYPFLSWAFTITKNTITDHYRKSSNEKEKIGKYKEEISIDQPNQPPLAINSSVLAHYKELGLSQNQVKLLKLKFESDLDYKEISDITNLSQINIRKIISRSIKKIKENLSRAKGYSNE